MGRYKYTDDENMLNQVLHQQNQELKELEVSNPIDISENIAESEKLLQILGYGAAVEKACENHTISAQPKTMVIPSWESLCKEAENSVIGSSNLESIFTEAEITNNTQYIKQLNKEYNEIHRLDSLDYTICALAGIIAGAVDILLVGIPKAGKNGVEAGPLSDFIRRKFDEKFPQEEMEKLANARKSKVSYDAQDNRHTQENIKGLSAYYHRLLSLGHDPLLGFVVGVFDIMTGRMTTIDKSGKFVSQVMDAYSDRKEIALFEAIAKQLLHLKSDITTSMGLPAPFMALFNLFQFGDIGTEKQTIAEMVQGMYYEGYDFIHFATMTLPTMLVEVMVRLSYCLKRVKEGHSIKASIPFSLVPEKHPKLRTMLFIAHAATTGINAGKVYFTKNPMAINYPQWIAFAKYSYTQLKWALVEKPELRDKYVLGEINEELDDIYESINETFEKFATQYVVVFSPE